MPPSLTSCCPHRTFTHITSHPWTTFSSSVFSIIMSPSTGSSETTETMAAFFSLLLLQTNCTKGIQENFQVLFQIPNERQHKLDHKQRRTKLRHGEAVRELAGPLTTE